MKTGTFLAALLVLAIPAFGAEAPVASHTAVAPALDLSWMTTPATAATAAEAAPISPIFAAPPSSCCVTARAECERTCLKPPSCGVAEFSCSSTGLTTCKPTCRCYFCE